MRSACACRGGGQRGGIAPRQRGVPVAPRAAVEVLVECAEQRVVAQPRGVRRAEGLLVGALDVRGLLLEAPRGARQALHAPGHDGREVDARLRGAGRIGQVGVVQPAARAQLLQVDQQHVAGERRRAHVGRVAGPDVAQRQHLPQALAAHHQPVDEMARRRAEVARAVRARQRGGMEQDAGGTGKAHRKGSSRAVAGRGRPRPAPRRFAPARGMACRPPASARARTDRRCATTTCQRPPGSGNACRPRSALNSSSRGTLERGPDGRSGSRARGWSGLRPGVALHRAAVGAQPGEVGQAVAVGQAVVPVVGERPRARGAAPDPRGERRAGPVGRATSRSSWSRCPGSRRCCCRPGCGRARRRRGSIGVPCDSSSVASSARCSRPRSAAARGVVASGPRRRSWSCRLSPCRRGCSRRWPRCGVRRSCTRSAQREAVVRHDVVDRLRRHAARGLVQVAGAAQAQREVAARSTAVAQPEDAHRRRGSGRSTRASRAGSRRPGSRRGPRSQGSAIIFTRGQQRVLRDRGEEGAAPARSRRRRAPSTVREVEAEAVDVHLADPVAQAVEHELQHARLAQVDACCRSRCR